MRSSLRIALRFLVIGCAICVSIQSVAASESFQLIPSARFLIGMESHYLWLWGDMLIPAGGRSGSGSSVNLGDLGVESTEGSSIHLHGVILQKHFINLDYLMFSPTGLTKAKKTFKFQNMTYDAGTRVETKLDFNWLAFGYGYRIGGVEGVILVPRIGVHHIRNAISVNGDTEETGVLSNTRRLDGTYPVIGLDTRYPFPFGIDLSFELEGIHMITRGFLGIAQATMLWELRPDMVLTIRGASRVVNYTEDNQPLNNEWFYTILGISAGLAFTF